MEATIEEPIRAMINGIAKGRKRVPPSGSLVVRNGDIPQFYPSRTVSSRRRSPPLRIARLVPVNTDAIGKQWEPATYEVGAEKIREFANAIGAPNPVHHDHDVAKSAGFRDLVAPPMFCVVYSARAMGPAILDPEVGINLATMLHGSQEFEWDEPVCDGDVISTAATLKEIYEKDGKGFYVFETVSTNQDGAKTVKGTWTNIVRGV
jgi:acyl dehydratase